MKIKTFDLDELAASLHEKLGNKKLDKRAYTMPEHLVMPQVEMAPVDISLPLTKQAVEMSKLLNEVHPKSFVMDNVAPDKEDATIENLQDQHAKIMKSTYTQATGKASKLAGLISQLSKDLVKGGHADLAERLDTKNAQLRAIAEADLSRLEMALRNVLNIVFDKLGADYDLNQTEKALVQRYRDGVDAAEHDLMAELAIAGRVDPKAALTAAGHFSDALTKFYHGISSAPGALQKAIMDEGFISQVEGLNKILARIQSELVEMDKSKNLPTQAPMVFTEKDMAKPTKHQMPLSYHKPVAPKPVHNAPAMEHMEGGRSVVEK